MKKPPTLSLSPPTHTHPPRGGQLAAGRRHARPRPLGGRPRAVRAGRAAHRSTTRTPAPCLVRPGRGRAGPAIESPAHQGDQVAEGGGHLDDAQGAVVHGEHGRRATGRTESG